MLGKIKLVYLLNARETDPTQLRAFPGPLLLRLLCLFLLRNIETPNSVLPAHFTMFLRFSGSCLQFFPVAELQQKTQ